MKTNFKDGHLFAISRVAHVIENNIDVEGRRPSQNF